MTSLREKQSWDLDSLTSLAIYFWEWSGGGVTYKFRAN